MHVSAHYGFVSPPLRCAHYTLMTVAYIFSARVVKVDFNDCTQERAGNRTLFCVCAAVSVCTLSSAGRGAVVGGCIARGKQRQSSETRVGVALFSIPSLPPKFKGHFTKFIQLRGIMQLGIKKQQLCTNSGFIVLHVAIISSLVDIFFFYQRSPSSVQTKVLCKRNHTSYQHSRF